MNVYELSAALDERIPLSLREEWDNDGLMVAPDGNKEIKKALVALDATTPALEYAAKAGADAVVTHHPLVFGPLFSLRGDDAVGKRAVFCIRHGIAVLSYHTRLDSLSGGVNDCLAEALGLKNTSAFLPFGRLGETAREYSFEEFRTVCEKALGEPAFACVKRRGAIKKAAVVSGGGKHFVRDAYLAGADVYVTGEADHAALIEAAEYGISMLCLTHHATERTVLPALARIVREAADNKVETEVFDFDRAAEYGV
ncbi:MAG: Nif3-like dinuclear metal center hexameric protein [Clostridia bacterium]|nr:Nif3-like dinuclear metal center hexameric protein [Clostridia bacterium]